MRRTFIIWINFSLAFFVTPVFAQYRPNTALPQPEASQCYDNADQRIGELPTEGIKIVQAVLKKDFASLMEFFLDEGVTLGPHHQLTKEEVKQQLAARKGWVYATFFDSAQLRKLYGESMVSTMETKGELKIRDHIKSIYDYFNKAPAVIIEGYRIPDLPFNRSTPLWAMMSFRWEGRPPKGIYYDPIFVCTAQGWKFSTFFNTP